MAVSANPERVAAWVLFGIVASEGVWVVLNWLACGARFVAYLGFGPAARPAHWLGWALAAGVAAAFVGQSLRLPSVRANLVRPSGLKALGLAVAVAAGILEEAVFRRGLMDYGQRQGWGTVLQVLASGLAFGLAHGIWGAFGKSVRAALGATAATGLLGAALAVVYLAGGRSLAPCVLAHFVINALVEPGLVLAAARGEMGAARKKQAALAPAAPG